MSDDLGDRMKSYEAVETRRRFMHMLPIYARIDGRCFSSFTRGMERPFDLAMTRAMIETTRHLVDATHARIGYTQSDEISLVWLADTPKSEAFFSGKVQKIVSILAGMATSAFMREIMRGPYADRIDKLPHFDARAFSLPSRTEAANAVLWREMDATKNAVSMAARSVFSARQLHGKKSAEMQEMLFEHGINFNDYPSFFKRGTFVRRETRERSLTNEELDRIPEPHRPDAEAVFTRSSVEVIDMPRFGTVVNREAVIFDGASPMTARLASRYSPSPPPVV